MKNNKGITLIMVIMTILVLAIILGLIVTNSINTWNNSKVVKFKTNMQVLQKKVDIVLEQGIDITTLGTSLTQEQQTKLQNILDNDSNNYIETNNTTDITLRYFSEDDIIETFEVEGMRDEFIVNFANREIISLNGIEVDGTMHYVQNGL